MNDAPPTDIKNSDKLDRKWRVTLDDPIISKPVFTEMQLKKTDSKSAAQGIISPDKIKLFYDY